MKRMRIHGRLYWRSLLGLSLLVGFISVQAQTDASKSHNEQTFDYSHLPDPTLPFWSEEVEEVVVEEKEPEPEVNWALQSIFKSSKGYLAIINGRAYRKGDTLMPNVSLIRFEKNAVWLDKRGEEVRLPLVTLQMNSP